MHAQFVLKMEPPRKTEQQHRIGGKRKNGQAIVYRDQELEAVRQEYLARLKPYAPPEPLAGPIALNVEWVFSTTNKRNLEQAYKTTRPDTDNMVKLLKDCMTECGFWEDDSQVAVEVLIKTWGKTGEIRINVGNTQLY